MFIKILQDANQITDDGAISIAQALDDNATLLKIDLSIK